MPINDLYAADPLRTMVPQRRRPMILDPATERGLIGSLAHRSASGIGALGNLLDVPGSVVRDVAATGAYALSGGQLGSLRNPIDQILPWNWFSPEKRITGRDLNRELGLAGSRDTWGNWTGGLGTEIALDPLTYFTGGLAASGRAGRLASRAGVMDEATRALARRTKRMTADIGPRETRVGGTLGDIMEFGSETAQQALRSTAERQGIDLTESLLREPLGGLYGTGFMGFGVTPRATGAKGLAAAQNIDRVLRNVRYSKFIPGSDVAPIQATAALVSASLGDMKMALGVSAAKAGFKGRIEAGAKARSDVAGWMHAMSRAAPHLMSDDPKAMYALRRLVEGIDAPKSTEMEQIIGGMTGGLEQLLKGQRQRGLNISAYLDPFAKYFPRFMVNLVGTKGQRVLKTFDQSKLKRLDFLWGLEGGTSTIMRMTWDDQLRELIRSGAETKDIANHIAANYKDVPPIYHTKDAMEEAAKAKIGINSRVQSKSGAFQNVRLVKSITPDQKFATISGEAGPVPFDDLIGAPKALNRYSAIAGWLKRVPEEVLDAGIYGNHPFSDLLRRLTAGHEVMAGADAMLDSMAEVLSVQKGGKLASAAAGETRVRDVLKAMEMTDADKAIKWMVSRNESLFGKATRDLVEAGDADILKAFKNTGISNDQAAEMTRSMETFRSPETAKQLMELTDNFTNMWKSLHTGPWSAFHSRNFVSGQFNNLIGGLIGKNYGTDMANAWNLVRGEEAKGLKEIPIIKEMAASRNLQLNDRVASELAGELVFTHRVASPFSGEIGNIVGMSDIHPRTVDDLMSGMPGPGRQQFSLARVGRKTIGRQPGTSLWKAWAARGVGKRTQSEWGVLAAGEEVGHLIETMNRVPAFLNQLRRGVDASEAAARVGGAQVIYDSMHYTPTERQWLTRAFPFYKFTKNMIPWYASMLSQRPGGPAAQSLRAINAARQTDPLTPQHVSESTGIPMPEWLTPPGQKRYLTGLGLAIEDPAAFVGSPGSVGREILSRAHPVPRGILEGLAGQVFWQRGPSGGRMLEDLDPTIARTISNVKQLAQNPMQFITGGERENVRVRPFIGSWFEHGMEQMPGSRFRKTARVLSDPRKGLLAKAVNLGTGFRFTDISPAAQDAVIREHMQDAEKRLGARIFSKSWFPDDIRAQLSPSQQQELLLLEALKAELQRRSEARAKQGVTAP